MPKHNDDHAPETKQLFNIDAELSIIGSAIVNPVKTFSVCDQLGIVPDWFYEESHRRAWSVLEKMRRTGKPIDPITVNDQAASEGMLEDVLAVLDHALPNDARKTDYILSHLILLRDKAAKRNLLTILDDTNEAVNSERTAQEILPELKMRLDTINVQHIKRRDPNEINTEIKAEARKAKEKGYTGLPSRWLAVQKILGGYPHGRVVMTAGRPKQGKTTAMLNECRTFAETFKAKGAGYVDIVTFEMDEAEIRSKIACDIAGLDLFSIDQGHAKEDVLHKYDKTLDAVADLPIRIHDNNMNIAQITSLMQEVKHDGGCGFFCLDYIQQIQPISGGRYSREQEVAQWSGAIMRTAKECHMATNVISQLSRASERDNRAPRLSDLRDSGALEQDAYRVMFIYQDPEIGEDDWADDVPTIFDVAANRRGPKGKIRMRFMKSQQHFVPDVHKNGG